MFAIVLFSLNVHAIERIDYCHTIEFDMGSFNKRELKKASQRDDCRDRNIPLILSVGSRVLRASFSLTRSTPSLVTYVEYDQIKNDYVFNPYEFEQNLKEAPFLKGKGLEKYTYKAT
jgi:hypothetical protein